MRAIVVGYSSGTLDLLQRRVGSILKGIAKVECCLPDYVTGTEADMYVTVAHHLGNQPLKKLLRETDRILVEIELALLPVAVRILKRIPQDLTLGVVAEHRCCANVFLSEIIQAGLISYRYLVGTIEEMGGMPVDKFLISEERLELIENAGEVRKEIIPLARSISPNSAAQIINIAVEIANNKA